MKNISPDKYLISQNSAGIVGPVGFDSGGGSSGPAVSVSIWDYLKLIRRHKLALVIAGILGVLCGFTSAVLQKRVYQATTTIEVQGLNESFMGMGAVDPQAGTGSYSSDSSNINTQLRIIESASVRAPVLERLERETTPVTPPANNFMDKLRQLIKRGPVDPLQEMRGGLGMAASTLKAKSVLGTRIISITCDSTIPDIAANFVNTIATEYVAQNTQLRSITSQKTSQWLESQLEETKIRLDQAEGSLREFVQKSGVTFIGEQDTLATSKLKQLQSDLAAIQADRIAKQAKYEMVKTSSPDAIPDVVADANIRGYQAKLADLRRELAQLTAAGLLPEHPKVKQIQSQITVLETTLGRERSDLIQRIENDYKDAQHRESLLAAAYSAQAGAVSSQSDKASQYALLQREVDIDKQTLNTLLQQVNQSAVVAAVPANNIRVVDAAAPPSIPYKPAPAYSMTIGLGLGLTCGFAFLLLRENLRQRKSALTFGAPGNASSVLLMPELGVIPSAGFNGIFASRPGLRWRRRNALAAPASVADQPIEPEKVALVAWQNKPSMIAESFRLTLTSITLMSRNGSRPRMLVVASPGAGEGKTTVASNMAAAMAEAGQRVLIIDMDLRRPSLHKVFSIQNTRGFTDLVRSNAPIVMDETEPFICATEIPNVSVLPSGVLNTTKIAELFHSPRVPSLLRQLRQSFDTIIIDTPPMLQFSESRLVASFSDGVILILRSRITDKDSAVVVRDQLSRDGIVVLGTILNDWVPQERDKYTYASYYGAHSEYQTESRT